MRKQRIETTSAPLGTRFILALVLAFLPAVATGESMTATVQTVNQETRTLTCLMGVGYAIQTELVRIPRSGLEATSIDPTTLVPGDLVHIHYRRADEGSVAIRVEKLRRDDEDSR